MSRSTKVYASDYRRDTVAQASVMAGEVRKFEVDFNGAIDAGRTLASVTWKTEQPGQLSLASLVRNTRSTSVLVTISWPGRASLLCTATLDNGEVRTQGFHVDASALIVPTAAGSGVASLTG